MLRYRRARAAPRTSCTSSGWPCSSSTGACCRAAPAACSPPTTCSRASRAPASAPPSAALRSAWTRSSCTPSTARARLRDELGVDPASVHVIPHGAFDAPRGGGARTPPPAPGAAPTADRARSSCSSGCCAPTRGSTCCSTRGARGPARGRRAVDRRHAAHGRRGAAGRPRRRACAGSPRFVTDGELAAFFRARRPRRCCPTARSTSRACCSPRCAFGTPLLLSRRRRLPARSRPPGAAAPCPPGDPARWPHALRELLADPARLARCAAAPAAPRRRDGPYGWDAIARAHARALRARSRRQTSSRAGPPAPTPRRAARRVARRREARSPRTPVERVVAVDDRARPVRSPSRRRPRRAAGRRPRAPARGRAPRRDPVADLPVAARDRAPAARRSTELGRPRRDRCRAWSPSANQRHLRPAAAASSRECTATARASSARSRVLAGGERSRVASSVGGRRTSASVAPSVARCRAWPQCCACRRRIARRAARSALDLRRAARLDAGRLRARARRARCAGSRGPRPPARLRTRRATRAAPSSLIVAAYHEEAVIAAKVANALALDWPRERLEVIVAVRRRRRRDRRSAPAGGRRPGARAAARRQDPRPGRGGASARAGELLAFSDANAVWEPGALRALVAPFADPRVGFACGQVALRQRRRARTRRALYWRYEMWCARTSPRSRR